MAAPSREVSTPGWTRLGAIRSNGRRPCPWQEKMNLKTPFNTSHSRTLRRQSLGTRTPLLPRADPHLPPQHRWVPLLPMLLKAEAPPPEPPCPGQPHREPGGEAGARSGDAPGEAAAGAGTVPGGAGAGVVPEGTRTGAAAGSVPGGAEPGGIRTGGSGGSVPGGAGTGPVPGGSRADPEQPRPRRPRDAGAAAP